MIRQNSALNILYASIGLLITSTLILVILVLPPSAFPEMAITAVWVNIIVRLMAVFSYVWTIMLIRRRNRISEQPLRITGFILIGLSFIESDGGFAYIGDADMHHIGILIFICVALDLISGLFAFLSEYYWNHRPLSK